MGSRSPILPRISPSNISDLECLKKFHTLRVLNQWPVTSGYNSVGQFGTAVHTVLKNLYSPQNSPRPDISNLEVYARQAFFACRYNSQIDRQLNIDRCIKIVRSYIQQDNTEDADGTIAVERSGEFTIERQGIPRFSLYAKLDRIIVRKSASSHIIVRDYKLSKPRLDLEQIMVQLWVAKLLYPGRDSYTAEVDWIDQDGRIERDVIEPRELRNIYGVLVGKIDRMVDAISYPAEPGELCTFCPLRPTCQPIGLSSFDSGADLFLGGEAAE